MKSMTISIVMKVEPFRDLASGVACMSADRTVPLFAAIRFQTSPSPAATEV